jgi:hypothetical protein
MTPKSVKRFSDSVMPSTIKDGRARAAYAAFGQQAEK